MKLASQMLSVTSLLPSTVENVVFLSVYADAAAGGDQDIAIMQGYSNSGCPLS
jgi:hypothetical protein